MSLEKRLLLLVLALALLGLMFTTREARSEDNPLTGLSVRALGTCTTSSGMGVPCLVLAKEGDTANYFALFTPDGREMFLLVRQDEKGTEVIWQSEILMGKREKA